MALDVDRPALVLHAVGDGEGGEPWRRAYGAAGWTGTVAAPDLPGHAGAAAPLGGNYELTDAVTVALGVPGVSGAEPPANGRPVVIGVGVNGWSAQLLALGGRAAALVLVDGLNGPWLDATAAMAAAKRWLRAVAEDAAAVAPAPTGAALDPRLRHGLRPHANRRLAERAAAAIDVPVLLIESGQSPLSAADRDELAGRFGAGRGADVIEVDEPAPKPVAEAVVAWARRR